MAVDKNFEKVLANIQAHPAVLKRCRSLYLQKLAENLSYVEIAERFHIDDSTAYRYFQAYRKIAQKYADIPNREEILAAVCQAIAFLQEKQKSKECGRKARDITMLGKLILSNQTFLAELQGYLERQPVMNMNFVQNLTQNIIQILPEVLKAQGLPEETIQNILTTTAERLEQAQQPA